MYFAGMETNSELVGSVSKQMTFREHLDILFIIPVIIEVGVPGVRSINPLYYYYRKDSLNPSSCGPYFLFSQRLAKNVFHG